MKKELFTERKIAVMQLKQGKTVTEVARRLLMFKIAFTMWCC
jgi:DNA-binding NarL/FixJ family response regulator